MLSGTILTTTILTIARRSAIAMTAGAIRAAMTARALRAIGLMSGTSHDGISAAIVEINPAQNPPARLIAMRSYPYHARLRARLLRAAGGHGVGTGEISALNFDLGRAFGRAALDISRRARIPRARLSFIGSHGHTVFHLPPRTAARRQTPSTLQLGESAMIAAMTGLPVVSDFRPMDIALGGEGAPLAPLAHVWMFRDRKLGRVIQNIGGIANATYVPPGGGRVIAFDTGPGVMLIDALAAKASGGRLRMDRDGRQAARGTVSEELLGGLMRDPYFRRRPPKSNRTRAVRCRLPGANRGTRAPAHDPRRRSDRDGDCAHCALDRRGVPEVRDAAGPGRSVNRDRRRRAQSGADPDARK